jgi:phosphopantetheinyl transferase (holo-ACP synthase)
MTGPPGDVVHDTRRSQRSRRVFRAAADLADVERLTTAARRSGRPFLDRVLTHAEQQLVDDDMTLFAVVFGIKECVVKLLHGLPPGAGLHDITLPYRPAPTVEVHLTGAPSAWARQHGVRVLAGTRPVSEQLVLAWAVAIAQDYPAPSLDWLWTR